MLRVECESCKSPYQVDGRRIPAAGLKMRCPKCAHIFVVRTDGTIAPSAQKPGESAKAGEGEKAKAEASPASAIPRTIAGVGPGAAGPKPGAPAPRPTKQEIRKPVDPASSSKSPAATPLSSKNIPAGVDLSDLPASPSSASTRATEPEIGDADLPAPVGPPKAPAKPGGPPKPPPPRAFKGTQVGVGVGKPANMSLDDLPAAAGSSKKQPAAPMAKGPLNDDLPVAVSRSANDDLPAVAGGAELPVVAGGAGLPAPKTPGAAGRIGVPTPSVVEPEISFPKSSPRMSLDDLPAVNFALPSPVRSAPKGANAKTEESSAGLELDFPSLRGDSSANPAFGGGGGFGELDLPSVADNLPSPAEVLPSKAEVLPMKADPLPVKAAPRAQGQQERPSEALPIVGAIANPGGMSFGDVDLGDEPDDGLVLMAPSVTQKAAEIDRTMPQAATQASSAESGPLDFGSVSGAAAKPTGVAAYGDIDLGGDGPTELSSIGELDLGGGERKSEEGNELNLANIGATVAKTKLSAKQEAPKKKSKAPVIALALVLAASGGGAALHLTPYGAFGHLYISDTLHAAEYDATTKKLVNDSSERNAADLFAETRKVADDALAEKARSPRARDVGAYAAVAEYIFQLRHVRVVDRAARARLWVQELPVGNETRYGGVAKALLLAFNQDYTASTSALQAAAKSLGGDPIVEDIHIARGELLLKLRRNKDAIEAYGEANKRKATARAQFGLMRAYADLGDVPNANKAAAEVVKLSPKHVGSRVLRAHIFWELEHDDAKALAELKMVTEGELKASAGPNELAAAHSERGWYYLSKGRAAEAKANFEDAIKLSQTDQNALLGLGELLYNEGRFAEALARMELGLQADSLNPFAIVSVAKTRIALEKLSDAKAELTAAQATSPTYWRVAYWLGRVEETIGNKPAAEKHYAEAIALADTRHLDAVLPYASYAVLLASSNRAADAKAKLEEAQKKLQDSSILQRAFGDVNASQGSFDIALQHYRSAVEKDPNDPTSHFKLATMFRKTRKNDEALQELEKVEKIDKEFPGLVVERGLLFEATGKTDKAIEQFKAALQKAPDDLDLQLRIGYAYIAVNQPAEAETLLRKVLEKRQDSAQANHALGRALLVQGDAHVSEALRYLKRAVELDPNRAENHLYVAWACNDVPQPQLGLAKAEIERALALDNLLADAYWQRGILLRKEGAVENAIKDLKRALELKPSRVEAHAALAEAYEDKNLPDLAISEWRLAVNTGTVKHHNWNYRFGRLLLAQGNRGEALTQLLLAVNDAEKAEVKPGWLTQSQFHTAELLKNAGRRQEAIERYKKYLEGAGNNSPDRRDAIKSLAELGAPWER